MSNEGLRKRFDAVVPKNFPRLGLLEEAHHALTFGPPELILLVGLGCLLLALVIFMGGGVLLQEVMGSESNSRLAINIIDALFAAMGIGCLWLLFWSSRRSLSKGLHWVVCGEGLVVLQDGNPTSYRWEQLRVWFDAVKPGLYMMGGNKRYKLKTDTGREIELPKDGRPAQKLIHSVQTHQVAVLMPAIKRLLDAGKTVKFEVITLGRDGMTFNDTYYRWVDIKRLEFEYIVEEESLDMLIVGRGKPSQIVELSGQVSNIWLMISVINSINAVFFKDLPDMQALLM
ncbi:MAG: DUF6585 family protein [Isosphaeraceae bacterium]